MSEQPSSDTGEPLDADKLTWSVLLGRWIEFARGALALPDDAQGRALRDSVSDIIALQAVWFALQHVDELDADEKALGLDRAEVLIERHAAFINKRWANRELPSELSALIADTHEAIAKLRST